MKKGPPTPKGFSDIYPDRATKRKMVMGVVSDVLENYGFTPLETPTVEFAETLLGKYGEEEKLIYQFEDRGGRKLALRYDLTVPLARFVANNLGLLNPTFQRYQIGQVFRGENPQKGRSREFTQFDFDIVGKESIEDDAKIIATAINAIKKLGLNEARMAINDRLNFKGVNIEVIRGIDKLYKLGPEKVKEELRQKKVSEKEIDLIDKVDTISPTPRILQIFEILKSVYNLKEKEDFYFDPTLARGLDYYTSTIFELKANKSNTENSIGGGGRYDQLIGMFAKKDIPAVGFSFGIDRIVDLL